jgi:hypothetical protein
MFEVIAGKDFLSFKAKRQSNPTDLKAKCALILLFIFLTTPTALCAPHFRETSLNVQLMLSLSGNQTIADAESYSYYQGTIEPIYKEYPLSKYVSSLYGIRVRGRLPLNDLFSIAPQLTYEKNSRMNLFYDQSIDDSINLLTNINNLTLGGFLLASFPMLKSAKMNLQIGVFGIKEKISQAIPYIAPREYIIDKNYLLVNSQIGPCLSFSRGIRFFPNASFDYQYSKEISKYFFTFGIDAAKNVIPLFNVGVVVYYRLPTKQPIFGISFGFNE